MKSISPFFLIWVFAILPHGAIAQSFNDRGPEIVVPPSGRTTGRVAPQPVIIPPRTGFNDQGQANLAIQRRIPLPTTLRPAPPVNPGFNDRSYDKRITATPSLQSRNPVLIPREEPPPVGSSY